MMALWKQLKAPARTGLVAGVLALALATLLLAWWLLRVDYQLLFADLKPQDAQAMMAELERLKIPYRAGADGASILVERGAVHATRMKLMGRDLPLHGAVGFELFNNADFGMTEFAQRINYQRALQGEIARTIGSMPELRAVRVLLALPEQGLFKQAAAKAKASVQLTLKQGTLLNPEQVSGIQRLVAAAVPGMGMQEVTIVDQQGLALTRIPGDGEGQEQGAGLELKRQTESYLARKVAAVLDKTLGAGQALATVDVTLNMDLVKTNTEDVVAAPTRPGAIPTGVVVKERETLREIAAPLDRAAQDSSGARGGSSRREVDYAVGRRVEQVVSQPGSIVRIQVLAALRTQLDAPGQAQLHKMVAAAVGAVPERGDVVVVQTLTPGPAPSAPASDVPPDVGAGSTAQPAPARDAAADWRGLAPRDALAAAAVVALVIAGVLLARSRRRAQTLSCEPRLAMSDLERQAVLVRIRGWMAHPTATAAAAKTTPGA